MKQFKVIGIIVVAIAGLSIGAVQYYKEEKKKNKSKDDTSSENGFS